MNKMKEKKVARPMAYKAGGKMMMPCKGCPSPAKCKKAGKCMKAGKS